MGVCNFQYLQIHFFVIVALLNTPCTSLWTKTTFEYNTTGLTGVQYEDIALFAGGINSTQSSFIFTDTVHAYNFTSKVWSVFGHLTSARGAFSSCLCQKKAFFVGGYVNTTDDFGFSNSNEIDIYDFENKIWTTDTFPTLRNYSTTATIGDLVFVFNDYDETKLDILNVTTGTWSQANPLSIRSVATTTSRNKLFFAGGLYLNGTLSSTVYVFDIGKYPGEWSSFSLPSTISTIAAISDILIFVGYNGAVEIRNSTAPQTKLLSTHTIIPRSGMSCVISGNLAVFAGGRESYSKLSTTVDIYNVVSSEWTNGNLSLPRTNIGAFGYERTFIFVGGSYNSYASDVVDILEVECTIDSQCQDSVFCNGDEKCVNNVCVAGEQRCASGSACNNSCNETAKSCFNSYGDLCENVVFCDGAEICDGIGNCISGAPRCAGPCQSCSEDTDSCIPKTKGFDCNDGLYCNGKESCDGLGSCVSAGAPCPITSCLTCSEEDSVCQVLPPGSPCDDGDWCNGEDSCAEFQGNTQCRIHTGNPCNSTLQCNNQCSSDQRSCYSPINTPCEFDNVTLGRCDGVGLCQIPKDDALAKEKNNTVPIAVGVSVGVLACICLVVTVAIVLRKRRKQKKGDAIPSPSTDFELLQQGSIEYSAISSPNTSQPPSKTILPPKSSEWSIPFQEIEMGGEIGRGAYGVVYRAKWRSAPVAIKKMLVDNMSPKDIDDFHRETSLMKSLRPSPNVVTLIGVCETPLCVITELYEKGSLRGLLMSNEKISESTRDKIIIGIARGMLHLHMESIVHRDLAARNVLLTSSYEAKISDFGLSRITESDGGRTETAVGPLRWMAPESLAHRSYSFASDVWAFGITLIELYTRKDPYSEENLDALNIASRVMRRELIPSIPSNVPQVVAKILEGCFEFQPEKRLSFKQICATLEMELPVAKT